MAPPAEGNTRSRPPPSIRAIFEHIGEPTSTPVVSPLRGPPAQEEDPIEVDFDYNYDLLAAPVPEAEFGQLVSSDPAGSFEQLSPSDD